MSVLKPARNSRSRTLVLLPVTNRKNTGGETSMRTGPMNILMASTPATGHLNPMLAIAHILIEDGHEVTLLTGTRLRERV